MYINIFKAKKELQFCECKLSPSNEREMKWTKKRNIVLKT
jgi:hypothetical protein